MSTTMDSQQILTEVRAYFDEKIATHGPSARGVDWNSTASQELRFEQLLKICAGTESFSLADYGCGYGALLDFLDAKGRPCTYQGFDVSEQMLAWARKRHTGRSGCRFLSDPSRLSPTDYTVASGIFNVRLGTNTADWEAYVFETLGRLNALGRKGFAFNSLTSYSDADRVRPDLHYADPGRLFDYCKRRFSRNVALLHDYGLYEFTMLVRK
jgi:SAM-dependent methyltransferase